MWCGARGDVGPGTDAGVASCRDPDEGVTRQWSIGASARTDLASQCRPGDLGLGPRPAESERSRPNRVEESTVQPDVGDVSVRPSRGYLGTPEYKLPRSRLPRSLLPCTQGTTRLLRHTIVCRSRYVGLPPYGYVGLTRSLLCRVNLTRSTPGHHFIPCLDPTRGSPPDKYDQRANDDEKL